MIVDETVGLMPKECKKLKKKLFKKSIKSKKSSKTAAPPTISTAKETLWEV